MAAMLAVSIPVCGETVRYSLDIDIGELKVDTVTTHDGNRFIGLAVNGLDNTAEMNEPVLPVKHVTISVPTYCNNVSARVTGSNAAETLSLGYPVLPFKDCTTNEHPEEIIYMPLSGKGYSCSVTSPQAEIADEFFLNGSEHFVTLSVYPVVYDAPTGKIRVFSNVEVDVSFSVCGKDEMKFRPLVPKDGSVLYDSRLLDCYDREGGTLVNRRVAASSTGDGYAADIMKAQNYLILVPDTLRDGVEGLSDWKRQKGYRVTVETYENILANPLYKVGNRKECFDAESGIREWMRDFYASNGAFYCLLIGDYRTSAPIRKFKSANTTAADSCKSDEGLDPTDIYFTDLISDWQFSKTSAGIYVSDISDLTFSPTVSVGRLICTNKDQINNYTHKLKLYESYPGRGNTEYLSRGIRVQHYDNVTYNDYGSIFNCLENIDTIDVIDNHKSSLQDLRPYPDEVLSEMENRGLYSLQCHGGPVGFNIAETQKEKDKEIYRRHILTLTEYMSCSRDGKDYYNVPRNAGFDAMHNEDCPGILYTLACDVEPFDELTSVNEKGDLYISNNMDYTPASAFTVAGKSFGGVAFIGNTRKGYFDDSGCMEASFSNCLITNSNIGIAENLSKINFASRNSYYGKRIIARHNIVGDPEINLWLGSPSSISGVESAANGVWTLNASGLNNGSYGICFGNTSHRNAYAAANGTVSISFKQAIANNTTTAIGSIFVQEKDCLPYMQLFTTGAQIIGQKESYNLVKASFGTSTANDYQPVLNLGMNADIAVSVYTGITSDNGITVEDGGMLTLKANKTAVFSNDSVKAGGSMKVSASEVTFEGGFSVEKGGILSVSAQKEKL